MPPPGGCTYIFILSQIQKYFHYTFEKALREFPAEPIERNRGDSAGLFPLRQLRQEDGREHDRASDQLPPGKTLPGSQQLRIEAQSGDSNTNIPIADRAEHTKNCTQLSRTPSIRGETALI